MRRYNYVLRIVPINIIMRERYELRTLRSDLTRRVDFTFFDFWCALACGGGETWVVRVGAGTSGETLAYLQLRA